MKIFLVSCVKSKLDRPASAKDLYQSTWFRLARGYAEQEADLWFILSAEHGLLGPDRVTAPYEMTLRGTSPNYRLNWGATVASQLRLELPAGAHEITILAGRFYCQPLLGPLEFQGHKITTPLQGLGIGQQQAWLKARIGGGS